MKKIVLRFFPLMILFVAFGFHSCVKLESPKAVIKVITVDENGTEWPVKDAEVTVDLTEGTSQPELIEYANKPKYTDINGEVEYSFTYEGIVKIKAEKGSGANSCGQGVLILKYNEIYQEKIRMSACYEGN